MAAPQPSTRKPPDHLTMLGDLLKAGYRVEIRPRDLDGDFCVALYEWNALRMDPPESCHYGQTVAAAVAAAWEMVR